MSGYDDAHPYPPPDPWLQRMLDDLDRGYIRGNFDAEQLLQVRRWWKVNGAQL